MSNLSKVFSSAIKNKWNNLAPADPSGKSIQDGIDFTFYSGDVATVYCVNFEETFRIKKNWSEGLTVSIKSKEIERWLGYY